MINYILNNVFKKPPRAVSNFVVDRELKKAAYERGYNEGWRDGYKQGWADEESSSDYEPIKPAEFKNAKA